MAILATSRRWLVTSLCAASGSSCCCQRLASMNSSSFASMGNFRISERYRLRPPSGDITASVFAAMDYPLKINRHRAVARGSRSTSGSPNHPHRIEVAVELDVGERSECPTSPVGYLDADGGVF